MDVKKLTLSFKTGDFCKMLFKNPSIFFLSLELDPKPTTLPNVNSPWMAVHYLSLHTPENDDHDTKIYNNPPGFLRSL